ASPRLLGDANLHGVEVDVPGHEGAHLALPHGGEECECIYGAAVNLDSRAREESFDFARSEEGLRPIDPAIRSAPLPRWVREAWQDRKVTAFAVHHLVEGACRVDHTFNAVFHDIRPSRTALSRSRTIARRSSEVTAAGSFVPMRRDIQ